MKRAGIIVVAVILLGVAIGIIYFYRYDSLKKGLTLYGNVDVRQVDIGFRVPGSVARLMFEEGDLVVKGALMAALDKTPYDMQAAQAAAAVTAIRVNKDNAEKLLFRRQALAETGGVSEEEMQNALANWEQLSANLLEAEAALAVAQTNLSYTEVVAPTDGIILTRIREPGSVVRESDPVYTLSIISPVWIRAFVNETQLGLIYGGMVAEIFTDTSHGKTYKGKVGFISPVAEFTPKTVETTQLRTDLVYRIRVYADNPDQGLRQGMPVTVKLIAEKK